MRIIGTKGRQNGLCLVFLGASILLLLLYSPPITPNSIAYWDFESSYLASRCLTQGCDPYKASEVLRVSQMDSAGPPFEGEINREIVTHFMYPPSALAVMVPFAMLPWKIARVLWMLLGTGSFILASVLAWDLGADYAPILSGALIGFLLPNSLVLSTLCNPSQIEIAFCVIAVWCFLRGQFVPAGILCFALSLAIKPPDPGMIWLYLLLAGGICRKRALNILSVATAISLPTFIWVWRVAPHWITELRSNLLYFGVRGGLNDPSPASTGPHTMINLQVVLSWLRDDPRFYNLASYLIFAIPLLLWVWVTLRSPFSREKAMMAIATIVPLSMLPLYHQLYCTKLLMLTIPALGILWIEGGLVKWLALAVHTTAFVVTGDIFRTIYSYLIQHFVGNSTAAAEQTSKMLLIFPVPIVLLIMGLFYLWVYAKSAFRQDSLPAGNANKSPIGTVHSETPVHG